MTIGKKMNMEHHGHGAIDPVCGMTVDPATAKAASFLFARVPSAGWTFVAVTDGTSHRP